MYKIKLNDGEWSAQANYSVRISTMGGSSLWAGNCLESEAETYGCPIETLPNLQITHVSTNRLPH